LALSLAKMAVELEDSRRRCFYNNRIIKVNFLLSIKKGYFHYSFVCSYILFGINKLSTTNIWRYFLTTYSVFLTLHIVILLTAEAYMNSVFGYRFMLSRALFFSPMYTF